MLEEIVLTEKTKKYFADLEKGVHEVYSIANEARAKGFDPVEKVEIPLALSMAEKVVGLISTIYPQMQGSGIDKRITELEEKYGKLDPTVVFKIAEEVAKQNFCKFENTLQAMDAGIRVGFAYTTLAVVSSPIEGYTGIKVRKTHDGKEYIEANFAGPIRSAGTTASCLVLMVVDYMRELFGYSKYDPTEDEIKRVAAELDDFHDRVSNLQYKPTEDEALFLARRMPIQVAGDASEKLEVSNYKNLERVETNFLRSGFCLVMAEGLAQKAAKGFRLYNAAKKNGVQMSGFDWLGEYIEFHEASNKGKKGSSGPPTYIRDLVAGRPVYGHPSRSGAFRFRYGRGRNSGFSATCLHPATMAISDNFIANGTQLKIEKPTKGCTITCCDSIDGPIVKLFNGSVKKLFSQDEAEKIYKSVEEIIYFGDILFPFSDLANRNYEMLKPGYVEEWWALELREKDKEIANKTNAFTLSLEDAVKLSQQLDIPLNPKFIYYWTEISVEQFNNLLDWLSVASFENKLIFSFNKNSREKFFLGKRALELLGVPHEVTLENVVLSREDSLSLLVNLGFDLEKITSENFSLNNVKVIDKDKSVLENINLFSKIKIKNKAGTFIGTRMGRPEKAKLRKLTGSPNALFPVGKEGGRLRSVNVAYGIGNVGGEFPLKFCSKCNKETIYPRCEVCGEKSVQKYYFRNIKEKSFDKEIEGVNGETSVRINLDMKHYFESAIKHLKLSNLEVPSLIKGVRGTSSDGNVMEHLAKGILRAKNNLQVNKDGTIRFDATELPLIAFKPKEIGASVEKLRELGYDTDVDGNSLERDDQILELMPHDVLLPSCSATLDEKADDVFVKISQFVDELLVRFYGLKPYYNIKKREDLIGKLGTCMAPHNCAGVICRFIGFSNSLGLYASPYMHAAIRRDCDGDEAAIMLLGDVLLNFSRKFLPGHRGGTQDAPLVLNAKIDPGEVDDQILDLELLREYPLDLYRKAEQGVHSSEVKVPTVKSLLKEKRDTFVGIGFTHDTKDFNEGVLISNYKLLETMQEKVDRQMKLVEKIRAVDEADVARLIIERHFIRDMRGNLRKFSMQQFRCVDCNEILRRPPLSGICPKCKGKIIFTIHEGGIKKYLEPMLVLAEKYNLSPYLKQSIRLVKTYIDSIFGKELEKQEALEKWF